MDLVLVAVAFYGVTEVDWYSSGVSEDFFAYGLATSNVQGYPAE